MSLEGPPEANVLIGGRKYQYHAGSGFLGLQSHPRVMAAMCEAVLQFGLGTATPRTTFTSVPVFEVETLAARLLRTERAMYFGSGFLVAAVVLQGLTGTYDRIFIDEAAHPALFDAARMVTNGQNVSLQNIQRYPHRDGAALEKMLKQQLSPRERPLVLTDGVFPMLGTIAPIDELQKMLAAFPGSAILIDDSCGLGILGPNGLGTAEHFGISSNAINRTATDTEALDDAFLSSSSIYDLNVPMYSFSSLSKAIGTFGGLIAGTESFVQRMAERSSIFAAASPPPSPIAAATVCGLELALADSRLRNQLQANIRHLGQAFRDLGLDVPETPVPIFMLRIGSALNMRRIHTRLGELGFLTSLLPRMAGLQTDGALRVVIFATHTAEMIEKLIDAFRSTI